MKTILLQKAALASSAMILLSQMTLAADKTYQVTGPVLEMSDSTITVQKGKEKWTMKKEASTSSKGDVKVGSKVTVEYSMTATSIEAKESKSAKGKK